MKTSSVRDDLLTRVPTDIRPAAPGLQFPRSNTHPGRDPFDDIAWERRTASIENTDGKAVFEQKDVEFPKAWSQQATNIVVSRYFRGELGTPRRERSVRQLIGRVVTTIDTWAEQGKYFATDGDREAFRDELKHLLLDQAAAFNSPVWFNCGVEPEPQCSACFINSVEDTMESILQLAHTEGMLFKYGSGTGTNLSCLRSSRELLAGGGTASGPVSFMKGYDAFAGVIKSGGKTRRAAKMVILNADHPDILDFIQCKVDEERKAWALIDAGYDGSFNGTAYGSVFFQNANNSVRLPDEFMRAVIANEEWTTREVQGNRRPVDTHQARELMQTIAEAAHVCGDPGLQFDTTINEWHTCPKSGRINASNPCAEYMFLDDSACNLASLNLLRFVRTDEPGEIDVERFRNAVRTMITAQEILVGNARYPTDAIRRNSHAYRPLGLGYANLGALLMSRGVAYDSDEGRAYAAGVTALMTGEAYAQSARIARDCGGPFSGYPRNEHAFLAVMQKHRDALDDVSEKLTGPVLHAAAAASWDEALSLGKQHGYRNAQATVLAPTGTIGFMMDCDTTGVEPDIALVKYKQLVGGGTMKLVNQTVAAALRGLGYDEEAIDRILQHIDQHETIEEAPDLDVRHLPVFDCAFKPTQGTRFIHYRGHLKMIGATQPFISGAISKTINVPGEASIEDIQDAYVEAWRNGMKAVSIYRNGSKRTQPVSTSERTEEASESQEPVRRKLPDERRAITHKFDIGGHEGYITVGMFDDGSPGEVFLVMAKEGSTISGFADSFAQAISYALQYGVPLQVLVDKFSHQRFEPSGITKNPEVRVAKSITDYMFRWLATKFLSAEAQYHAGVNRATEDQDTNRELQLTLADQTETGRSPEPGRAPREYPIENDLDAPPCSTCGAIMIRNGACYKCTNCGATSGCA